MRVIKKVIDSMIAHARKDTPIEVCGYLAAKDGCVVRHYELTNIDQSQEHFSFDPKEQFDVMRSVRDEGLELSAVYHSHPATPARPSEEDIKLAYDPNISYVIVSLADGNEDVRSFKICDSIVEKEVVEVVDEN